MGRMRRLAAGLDEAPRGTSAAGGPKIIHATARGAVLTWLSLPEERRDPALFTTLRESMVSRRHPRSVRP
ncbi:hypothetical protein SVIOM342S_06255 [Streptomyces violaceorubidus]